MEGVFPTATVCSFIVAENWTIATFSLWHLTGSFPQATEGAAAETFIGA
jgi:hypothetical protein